MAKFGLVLGMVLLLAVVVLWPEIPSWRIGGTASQPMRAVSYDRVTAVCPAAGGLIELRGDSHVTGARMGAPAGQTALPYGLVLERELGAGRRVILNGRGGAIAQDGVALAKNNSARPDLLLIAFGTNDAAPRGWLRSQVPVPLQRFQAALAQQIVSAHAAGTTVALIAPPPTGSTAMNRRLAPYRSAVRELGERQGVAVLDPAEAFGPCHAEEPMLVRDALHLNQGGHECVGKWLAQKLCGPMN